MRRRLEKYPGRLPGPRQPRAPCWRRAAGRRRRWSSTARPCAPRPDSAPVLNNLGAAAAVAGQEDEALAAYRAGGARAAGLRERPLQPRQRAGRAGRVRGGAARTSARSCACGPDDAAARNNLGAALLATGRAAEAIAELRRAVAADPGSLNAQFNLGRALAARGDLAGAAAQFEQALRIDPGDALAAAEPPGDARAAARAH